MIRVASGRWLTALLSPLGLVHDAPAARMDESGMATRPPTARNLYDERRRRDAVFQPDLFGEPAWDILLALAAAADEGRSLSVAEVSASAGLPATAASRWVGLLEGRGLIERVAGPHGEAAPGIRMSADGLAKMLDYFEEIERLHAAY